MATATKASNGTSIHPEARFASLNSMTDPLQLSPAVESRVEPYELVELFYGSSTVSPATHASQLSPRSAGTSSPEVMQVIEQAAKEKLHPDSYTCEVCGRNFREASHFTKHKRGALCRKLAQRMAKKTKKKKGSGNQDSSDKRNKQAALHKPYMCNVCGAKFCDKVNVELHLERQHNCRQHLWVEVPKNGGFTCAECDRWFPEKSDSVEHQRQHMATYLPPMQRLNHGGGDTQGATVVYYHEPLQQVQPYGGQQATPQPPPPSHLPPNAPPPPVAHMHTNMTTILHTPQLTSTSLIPVSQPINTQPSVSTQAPVTSMSSIVAVESLAKSLKSGKGDRLPSNSKWNICGDCGHRFVDPMNLELHIQRKHPDSYMIETVNLGGGTILYKTNNTRSDVQCLITQNGNAASSELKANKTNSQTFDCILCGYKATSKSYILYHLQNIHSTSNTDFIHVLETLESGGKKGVKGSKSKKGNQDPLLREQRHVCDTCSAVFLSKAELIRHRIKDKQYMCGVCCHSSCSQQQVTTHMTTQHPHHYPSMNGGLACWICGSVSATASAFDDHLVGHGSVTAECVSCGERGERLGALLSHVGVHLPRQSSRIRLTVVRSGQLPSSHAFEVAVNGTIQCGLSVNRASPMGESVPTTRVAPAYACSECGACLAGAAQLEAHLQLHQNNSVVAPEVAVSSNNSGTFTSTTATVVPNTATSVPTTGTTTGGVCRVPGSFEFRCEECGFWRQDSEPVMRHIQAVHMSGNMLHSIKLHTGLVQIHPIHVVTPISSLSAQ